MTEDDIKKLIEDAVLLFMENRRLDAINVIRHGLGLGLRESRLLVRREARRIFGDDAAPIERDVLVSDIDIERNRDTGTSRVFWRGRHVGWIRWSDDDSKLYSDAYGVIRTYLLEGRVTLL